MSLAAEDQSAQWKQNNWDYDIFVSHAGEDKDFAYLLRDKFQAVGLKAFVDEADLEGGAQADVKILRAVKQAPVGLALFSKRFFEKDWPMRELKIIVGAATLLPVLYGISHEDAEAALAQSPAERPADPEAWRDFVTTVLRTTAVKNPSVGKDKLHFLQLIVYSAVGLCVSTVTIRAEDLASKVFAYNYVQRLEGAANLHATFDELKGRELAKAQEWAVQLRFLGKSMM